ncbi:SERTA domain-containing protein 2b [Denticeps clupeoides]|uniref:SERTA domain-containing protein n=1 Tax=Denticeps clupeoides TaxID=299321 RepID=A0AAY4DMS4_9TELE|nr:SERTA domain-containing protein 2 [Denticeps clupeoides]
MLGKGTKRKLDEDEDGLEGKAPAPATGTGSPPDGLSKVSYTLQRQTIFNISLMKLYSQRALSEPSLERRVLINNMLRRIQEELKQEGNLRPLFLPPPSPPADHSVDEGFREAQPAFGVLSVVSQPLAPGPAGPASPQACLTPASLLEEDASAFCTSPLLAPPSSSSSSSSPSALSPAAPLQGSPSRLAAAPGPRDSFSSALDEIEELCPSVGSTAAAGLSTSPSSSSSSSSPLPTLSVGLSLPALGPALPVEGCSDTSGSKDCTKACSHKPDGLGLLTDSPATVTVATEPRLMDTLPPSGLDMTSSPSSCSSSSSGFLTDLALDDILFADIDTSMYDFDTCTPTSGAGATKLSPVVTADDLLKTLSPYSSGAPTVTPSQPFKMDLTELDHIMEVLVGS